MNLLLLETKIKYLGVKFRKGLKKPEVAAAGIIKDADDLCVRVLLFLLCFKGKDLEKIDIDFLRGSINEYIEDDTILETLDYLKAKNILDYKYERADITEYKGANMDKIASLIGNICDNISNMSDGEYKEPEATQEQLEFERIYRLGRERGNIGTAAPRPPNIKEPETTRIIESAHEEEPVKFEKIEKIEFESAGIFENISLEINTEEKSSHVTIDMICDELEKNMDFRDLYENVQHKLQAIINPHELEIIYNLYNKMEPELLLKIAEYCGEASKNSKTVVNYFEKTALGLCNDGIVTAQQYDEYIENAQKASEYEIKIRKMFGLGDRKLTAKERGFIKTWALEYDFSDEMMVEGFNIALDKNKATIPYINAIYLNWHEKGFKTVEEIKSEFSNKNVKQQATGFNSDELFEKLVKKSLKF